MMLLVSVAKAQRELAESVRERRILIDLTQAGLAERSGVPLSTIRKFEQKGLISLESFLKLLMVLGGLEEMLAALKPTKKIFKSIDDVLNDSNDEVRKRGRSR